MQGVNMPVPPERENNLLRREIPDGGRVAL